MTEIEKWQDLCSRTRVGGRMPTTFRVEAAHRSIRLIAETRNDCCDDATKENRLYVSVDVSGYKPDVGFLMRLARQAYDHELGEWFITDGARPFVPSHDH